MSLLFASKKALEDLPPPPPPRRGHGGPGEAPWQRDFGPSSGEPHPESRAHRGVEGPGKRFPKSPHGYALLIIRSMIWGKRGSVDNRSANFGRSFIGGNADLFNYFSTK